DLKDGKLRPIGPDSGRFGAESPISPDGRQILLRTKDRKLWLLDADGGGVPRPVSAFPEDLYPIRWCADGRSVFARRGAGIYRVDLSSGRTQLWKEFASPGRGGLDRIVLTADGSSYVLNYGRYLSDLWTIDGVR